MCAKIIVNGERILINKHNTWPFCTYLFSSFIIHYQLFWSGIFLGVLLKFLSSFTYFLKNLYWTRSLIIIIDRFCTFFLQTSYYTNINTYVLIIAWETVTPVTSLLNLLWQRRAFFSLLLFVKYFAVILYGKILEDSMIQTLDFANIICLLFPSHNQSSNRL